MNSFLYLIWLFLPFSLKVQMQNGDVYEANIKDIDKKSDIATIKINSQVSVRLYEISLKSNTKELRPVGGRPF